MRCRRRSPVPPRLALTAVYRSRSRRRDPGRAYLQPPRPCGKMCSARLVFLWPCGHTHRIGCQYGHTALLAPSWAPHSSSVPRLSNAQVGLPFDMRVIDGRSPLDVRSPARTMDTPAFLDMPYRFFFSFENPCHCSIGRRQQCTVTFEDCPLSRETTGASATQLVAFFSFGVSWPTGVLSRAFSRTRRPSCRPCCCTSKACLA